MNEGHVTSAKYVCYKAVRCAPAPATDNSRGGFAATKTKELTG
jgi:hypothetical protein